MGQRTKFFLLCMSVIAFLALGLALGYWVGDYHNHLMDAQHDSYHKASPWVSAVVFSLLLGTMGGAFVVHALFGAKPGESRLDGDRND